MHDVIVVGGGTNGLTCAAYLARAGKHVMVVEANPQVGGFCVTTDLVPEAPGYHMNPYSINFYFTDLGRSVGDELDLQRFGLRWVFADPLSVYLSPDGGCLTVWRDIDRTCSAIAHLSRRDAATYKALLLPMMDLINTIVPYLQDHPTRPSAPTLIALAKQAAKSRRSLGPAMRTLLSSPLELIDRFEREELRAYLAVNNTGGMRPLGESANGSMFLFQALMHMVGSGRAVGGSGAFSDALAECVKFWGGEVRTSAPVDQIVIRGGKASGIVLQNGEEFQADQVVAAVDPTSLFTSLVESSSVPQALQDEVRRMQVLASGVSHFIGNLALARRPNFPRHSVPDLASEFVIAPSVEYILRSEEACARGELSDEAPMFFALPSVHDRTLIPRGSNGDVLYLYALMPPYQLSGGRDWADVRDVYLDNHLRHLEEYAPGLRESIIGAHTTTPRELNAPWNYKESSRGVDLIPSQMGPWRPSPSLSGYRTPIDGLWHTGPGSHPMSGVSGWAGRTAARTMLKVTNGKARVLPWGRARAAL